MFHSPRLWNQPGTHTGNCWLHQYKFLDRNSWTLDNPGYLQLPHNIREFQLFPLFGVSRHARAKCFQIGYPKGKKIRIIEDDKLFYVTRLCSVGNDHRGECFFSMDCWKTKEGLPSSPWLQSSDFLEAELYRAAHEGTFCVITFRFYGKFQRQTTCWKAQNFAKASVLTGWIPKASISRRMYTSIAELHSEEKLIFSIAIPANFHRSYEIQTSLESSLPLRAWFCTPSLNNTSIQVPRPEQLDGGQPCISVEKITREFPWNVSCSHASEAVASSYFSGIECKPLFIRVKVQPATLN